MQFETLEPRLLLSADPVSGVDNPAFAQQDDPWPVRQLSNTPALVSSPFQPPGQDGGVLAAPDPELESQPYLSELPEALDLADLGNGTADEDSKRKDFDTDPLVADAAIRHELVIVDARVEGHETLVSNLLAQRSEVRNIQVYVVDPSRDGVEQVTGVLSSLDNLDAIHVISHGNERGFQLGSSWVDGNDLEEKARSFEAWGRALADDGDLLLYGCNLAASAEGTRLLETLGTLTGADIAASTDLTGNALLGGDWDLEYSRGSIETALALNGETRTQWQGLLATVTVDTTVDLVDGNVTSVSALIGSPGGAGISLREAILATNATSGADEIVLGPGIYTLTFGSNSEDFAAAGDLDIRGDLTITGADARTTIIDGNANDRIFHVLNGATVDISGVTLRNGGNVASGAGAYVEAGTQLAMSNAIVAGNLGDVGSGIRNDGTLTLTDVSLTGNGDGTNAIGGGLANTGDATLNRVTIDGNRASTGAGIHNGNGATSLTLTNVTLSGNIAATAGGGLFTRQSTTITNSTITANSASAGGGIALSGGFADAIMTNTIVAGNTVSGTGPDILGTVSSQGYNIIGDVSDGTGFVGTDRLNQDPGLDPNLSYNGGFTQTHALLAGSVAIGGGTATGAPSVDQRVLSRDGAVDIGAFEVIAASGLSVTTDGDVNSGNGVPGLNGSSWQHGDLLAMQDPNLSFGAGSTDGTFSVVFDAELYSPGAEISGLHYVTRALTLGRTYSFNLQPGDLLLTVDGTGAYTFVSNGAVPESDLVVEDDDVFVFRPDSSGDYSKGNFYLLLDAPLAAEIRAISLIERDTWVGDTWLQAGDFLFSRAGPGEDSDVKLFRTIDVEDSSMTRRTNGTVSDLLVGGDSNIAIDERIFGLELLENTLTIGGVTLNAGTILVKLQNGESLGSNNISVNNHDIVALTVSQTTLGAGVGNGSVTATKFFDGNTVAFDSNEELISGLTLTGVSAPAVNTNPYGFDDAYTVDEDTALDSNDAWWDSNWSFRRTLSFDNAGRGQNLTDFPVLVVLDSTRIDYGQTQNNGEDLRFVDGDGTLLAHEIEEWNESGTSYVWVKVPQIDANSGKDFIWMYYGNAGAADGQSPGLVWSNGFQAVYHFDENPGPTGTLSDSTGAFDGTNAGSGDVVARIGRGQEFDGSNDHVDMGFNQPFLNSAGGATVSGWIRADATTVGNILGVSVAGGPTNDSRVTLILDSDRVQIAAISDDSEGFRAANTAPGIISTGTWYHVAGVVDYTTGDLTVYVDGVERGSNSVSFNSSATPGSNSWRGVIGANEDGGSRWFDGIMDEVRLADTARSASWISAQYASTSDTFITYGYEQTVAGVLGNDIDQEGDALTAVLVSGPANAAAFSLNANGSFTYTPVANFNGSDTFQYRANDGTSDSGVTTVTITVNPVNDVPVAVADGDTTPEDTAVTTVNVLSNDSLGDAPTTITAFDAASANGGSVVSNGDGTFDYTPPADFNGSDTFTYTITDTDNETSVGTVTVTVTPVNDVPAAANDGSATLEDTAVTTANVLSNDTLGDTPTAITSSDTASVNGGTVVDNGNGTFTYTPATDFNGSDSFTYTITDNDGETSTATVTVTVTPVNDVPIAYDDGATTPEDTAVTTANVLTNDDRGDQPTTISAFDAVSANGGTVVNNGDGTFDYTPAADFSGSDTFTYTITDTDNETSVGTVTVTVTPVNDVPVAVGDSDSTVEDTAFVTVDVLANDSLGDQPTSVTAYDNVSANGAAVSYNGNGTFTYIPVGNFNGADSFTYTITDLDGESSVATVDITVTPVNDVPAAGNDSSATLEDTAVTTGNVLSNDTLGDTPTAITSSDTASANGGTVVDNGNGTFTYTPSPGFNGSDSFTYTITDNDGETSTATVTVTVTPVNGVPAAVADGYTTNEDVAVTTGNVLVNDTLGDAPTTITAFDALSSNGGTVINNADGTFSYTPAANFSGSDSFTYTIADADGESSTATVTVAVRPVNDAPVAVDDGYRLLEGEVITIAANGVLGNDTDAEADSLTATLIASPANGSLRLAADGSFVYTPDAGFSGTDSFIYRASDGTSDSSVAVVVLTVDPVPGSTVRPPAPESVASTSPDPEPLPTRPISSPSAPLPEPSDLFPSDASEDADASGPGADDVLSDAFNPATEVRRGAGGGTADTDAGEDGTETVVEEEVPPVETPPSESPPAAEEPVTTAVEETAPLQIPFADGNPLRDSEVRRADREGATNFLRGDTEFTRELDSLRKKVEEDVAVAQAVVGSGVVMATGISVGYVVWMTRGGLLLLSLMSSMPAWRLIDPIPVLGRLRDKRDDDDEAAESLRSLVEGEGRPQGADSKGRSGSAHSSGETSDVSQSAARPESEDTEKAADIPSPARRGTDPTEETH